MRSTSDPRTRTAPCSAVGRLAQRDIGSAVPPVSRRGIVDSIGLKRLIVGCARACAGCTAGLAEHVRDRPRDHRRASTAARERPSRRDELRAGHARCTTFPATSRHREVATTAGAWNPPNHPVAVYHRDAHDSASPARRAHHTTLQSCVQLPKPASSPSMRPRGGAEPANPSLSASARLEARVRVAFSAVVPIALPPSRRRPQAAAYLFRPGTLVISYSAPQASDSTHEC